MARPEKNSVDYFPFFCEEGKKMYYIEETYGNDGFAVFVKLLRELAKSEFHYLDLSKPTTMMFVSAKCKVSKELLSNIINDLVELGKFDRTLWTENRIIWCQDFIDSIQDAYSKRNNKCITLDGLFNLLCGLGIRKLNKCIIKGDDNTQSKEKKRKEDESKEEKKEIEKTDFLEPAPDVSKKLKKIEIHATSPDVKKIVNYYNENCISLKPVMALNEKRIGHISARIREHGIDKVFLMLDNAKNSKFLAGQNKRKWTADFDWIFQPSQFISVLECKYNDYEQHRPISSNDNLGGNDAGDL